MEACEAVEQAELDNGFSNAEMMTAEHNLAACLGEANSEAAGFIDSSAQDAGVFFEPSADAIRALSEASLCNDLIDASDGRFGSISGLYFASCGAEHERNAAHLVDAYVDFGVDPIKDYDLEAKYPDCFAAFDTELETAFSQNQMTAATFGLASCIGDEVESMSARVVDGIMENAVRSDLRAEVEAEVTASLDRAMEAASTLCQHLADAGSSAGGSLSRTDAAFCQADAAMLIGEQIRGYTEWIVG